MGFGNFVLDLVSQCEVPIERLDPPPPGGGYVDFQYDVRVPLEYQDDNNDWIPWFPDQIHGREFRGVDAAARIRKDASLPSFGAWQGPWQGP